MFEKYDKHRQSIISNIVLILSFSKGAVECKSLALLRKMASFIEFPGGKMVNKTAAANRL